MSEGYSPDHVLLAKEMGHRSSAAILSSFTDIGAEIVNRNIRTRLFFELSNTHASVALTDFQLLIKATPDADYVVYLTGATWGTIAGVLRFFSGALNTLAGTAKGLAFVDLPPCYAFKFQGKTGSTGAASVYFAMD